MGTTTALLATGLTAFGQIQQGQQQAQAASYNAAVARQKAQAARQAGELEAEKIRKQKERLTGRQKALYAKAGVTFSGSPMEVMIDSATDAEMDALITEYNYSVEASQAESQAQISNWRAKTYRSSSWTRAGATLLTGASESGLFDKAPSKT
jgi:uncharacterized protein involved in type VI secretion and phage assembly